MNYQSGIVAFVLGMVGTLFFMQLLAAANKHDNTDYGLPPVEQRPTIH